MLRVGIRLCDVFALDVHALVLSGNCRIKHVRDTKTGLGVDLNTPVFFKSATNGIILNRAVARKFVRKRTHVTGSLYVVLATQRIDATTGESDVASRHGQIGHSHYHGRSLAVLCNAQSVVNCSPVCRGVHPCCIANVVGRHACNLRN